MRKVYQIDNPKAGFAGSLGLAAVFTAVLFAVLPFAHRVAKPERRVELRKTSVADLPPPPEELPQAQLPPESPAQEPTPPPDLSESPPPLAINPGLDVVTGSGGALAGFGDLRQLTAVETTAEETFDITDLEKRPEPVSQVAPVYPAELRKAKVEGFVTLVFVLTGEGKVENPRVDTSSRSEFEKPALEAIRKWRFKPGMKDGQPVQTFIRLPMRFRISSS